MRASGPTAPKFGPKQTRSLAPRDVGIGGGPTSAKGQGANRRDDPGLHGEERATAANNARSSRGTEMHKTIVNEVTADFTGGKVKGQEADGPGKGGKGAYDPKKGPNESSAERVASSESGTGPDAYRPGKRFGGVDGHMGSFGKGGRDASVAGFEHQGYEHTSKDR